MSVAISLPAVLDLRAAEPLRAQILAVRGQALTLDGASVERLGGLCLQVLLSARQTWAADGQALEIAPVSEAFSAQWDAFGAPALDTDPQGQAA
ncbi:STAS domain-containing protein [Brevundimonas sp.]|uniref:STAS domain-containing protein n=1 Tax=Brevundimonas sp. TaxID=1871086 RepID=UPI003D6CB8CB